MTDAKRATPTQVRAFFEKDGGRKVTMQEIKDLKTGDGKDYSDIAEGIGNGTLTY